MIDKRSYEEIIAILQEIQKLNARLSELLSQNNLKNPTIEINRILGQIEEEVKKEAIERFYDALARLNLRDEKYKVIRIIDGDTLEVEPPEELQEWMRDIHVRLYGIDTPERNEELGELYTNILKHLCNLDQGYIHIVWERERKGTEYEGFPTASFERGIGNIFVDIDEENVLYVNAILASLLHVKITKGNKQLIRVLKYLRDWPHHKWHYWHHHWIFHFWPWFGFNPQRFEQFIRDIKPNALREELNYHSLHHHICVYVLPRKLIRDTNNNANELYEYIDKCLRVSECPTCKGISDYLSTNWMKLIEEEKATPLDVFLLLAYSYGHFPTIEIAA